MKHFKCQTWPCEQKEWMDDAEMKRHLAEHPDHKIYDVRTDLARQYGCASVEEFDEMSKSLAESGANKVKPFPSESYPDED